MADAFCATPAATHRRPSNLVLSQTPLSHQSFSRQSLQSLLLLLPLPPRRSASRGSPSPALVRRARGCLPAAQTARRVTARVPRRPPAQARVRASQPLGVMRSHSSAPRRRLLAAGRAASSSSAGTTRSARRLSGAYSASARTSATSSRMSTPAPPPFSFSTRPSVTFTACTRPLSRCVGCPPLGAPLPPRPQCASHRHRHRRPRSLIRCHYCSVTRTTFLTDFESHTPVRQPGYDLDPQYLRHAGKAPPAGGGDGAGSPFPVQACCTARPPAALYRDTPPTPCTLYRDPVTVHTLDSSVALSPPPPLRCASVACTTSPPSPRSNGATWSAITRAPTSSATALGRRRPPTSSAYSPTRRRHRVGMCCRMRPMAIGGRSRRTLGVRRARRAPSMGIAMEIAMEMPARDCSGQAGAF